MKYEDYIKFCRTTESVPVSISVDKKRLEIATQLVVQSNELLDLLKKNAFYGKSIDETKWINIVKAINTATNECVEHDRLCATHPQNRDEVIDFDVRTAHSIIGMSTETGEIVEAFQKAVFGGEEFDEVNFGEEMGDLQYYTAIGVDAGNLNFDQILQTNKTKLENRYSSGSFSSEEAIKRNLDNERDILESGFNSEE